MKIDVHFEPAAPLPDLTGSTVVVIDVLRATSSMVEALVNGAQGVYPAPSTEEAIKLASSLGREDTILCGEARGHVIEGISTTIPFLADITRDEQFVAGGVDTGFVDRFLGERGGN